MAKRIHVAAAIIYCDGRFLLSKRQNHQHQGGKWEFPGGKVEQGETAELALKRELQEEINIVIDVDSHTQATVPFYQLEFEYPEKVVLLEFFLVNEFSGEPLGLEGQEVNWFSKTELLKLSFPDANVPVLEKIAKQLK